VRGVSCVRVERGNMGAAKEGKKNLLSLPLNVREEEDIQCRSK
jgi:hypothetical protein